MVEGSADDQTMKVEPESEKSLGMMAILAQQSETLGISLAAMNAPPPPEVVTHQQNHPSVPNDPADNTPKIEPVTSSAADAMAILAEQSTAMGTAPADDQSIILPGVISASGGGVAAQDHAIMSTAPAAANARPWSALDLIIAKGQRLFGSGISEIWKFVPNLEKVISSAAATTVNSLGPLTSLIVIAVVMLPRMSYTGSDVFSALRMALDLYPVHRTCSPVLKP